MSKHILAVTTLLFLTFALAGKNASAATIEYYGGCSIGLHGEIDSKTPQQLKHAIDLLNRGHCKGSSEDERDIGTTGMVYLQSPGGDLVSAIALGRLIRHASLSTRVDGSCASACVLVELGGVYRTGFGRFGLHRPYATSYSDSLEAARTKVRQANALVAAYLTEMGIPARLLDVMNATPPDEIEWLYGDKVTDIAQLDELQILGVDPGTQDLVYSKLAEQLGISKSELYARLQRAHVVCDPIFGNTTKYLHCLGAIEKGVK